MVSVDIGDGGGEGIPVLEMSEEEGELHPLHVEVAPIELVMNAGEHIRNAVELAGELGVFVLELPVAVDLGDRCQVIEAAGFFDEGMENSIPASEDGKEPQSCCFGNGVLSIVRPEEKLCNIGGFPRLPPANSSTCPFLTDLIHSRTTIRPPPVRTAVVTQPSLCSKPLGMLRRPSRAHSCWLSCAHCLLIHLSCLVFCSASATF
jgi:hypothetical protein